MAKIDETGITEYINRTKAEYLQRFESLATNIKEEHLNKFRADDETEEVCVKVDSVQKQLKDLIVNEFTKVWEEMNIEDSLHGLEAMKLLAKNKDAWRPTGKTVAEQTKSYRIKVFQGQIDYFQSKITKQQGVLESLIVDVEGKRRCMDNITKQRKFLRGQMKVRKDQLAASKETNKRLLLKLEDISEDESSE